LNLEIELKNFILVAFRLFAFLHSQGQKLVAPKLILYDPRRAALLGHIALPFLAME
jgi:hypothetical protein